VYSLKREPPVNWLSGTGLLRGRRPDTLLAVTFRELPAHVVQRGWLGDPIFQDPLVVGVGKDAHHDLGQRHAPLRGELEEPFAEGVRPIHVDIPTVIPDSTFWNVVGECWIHDLWCTPAIARASNYITCMVMHDAPHFAVWAQFSVSLLVRLRHRQWCGGSRGTVYRTRNCPFRPFGAEESLGTRVRGRASRQVK